MNKIKESIIFYQFMHQHLGCCSFNNKSLGLLNVDKINNIKLLS